MAKATTNRSATAVVASLKSKDRAAKELFRTANAVSGVAVIGDAAQIRALAGRSDVKSIRLLIPKKIDNAHSAELINVLATWQDLGVFGAGVRVGIIDTGIDYTHANFGGPGTAAAYDGVDPTGVDPALPERQGRRRDRPRRRGLQRRRPRTRRSSRRIPTATRSTATATARTSPARPPARRQP